jgi:hypothetical protein
VALPARRRRVPRLVLVRQCLPVVPIEALAHPLVRVRPRVQARAYHPFNSAHPRVPVPVRIRLLCPLRIRVLAPVRFQAVHGLLFTVPLPALAPVGRSVPVQVCLRVLALAPRQNQARRRVLHPVPILARVQVPRPVLVR